MKWGLFHILKKNLSIILFNVKFILLKKLKMIYSQGWAVKQQRALIGFERF